jgi:hypothetical protein
LVFKASIRTDTEDEAVSIDSEFIPHVGPIEGKLLKGSDGRMYALEMMRLTPRDANYVRKTDGGTGNISEEYLDFTDSCLGITYVYRHELISIYVQVCISTDYD